MMKISELPNRWRIQYGYVGYTRVSVRLLKLGAIKYPNNPYFAVQEQQVENRMVRYLGAKPLTQFSNVLVERDDGTSWSIRLENFTDYEFIDEVEMD